MQDYALIMDADMNAALNPALDRSHPEEQDLPLCPILFQISIFWINSEPLTLQFGNTVSSPIDIKPIIV